MDTEPIQIKTSLTALEVDHVKFYVKSFTNECWCHFANGMTTPMGWYRLMTYGAYMTNPLECLRIDFLLRQSKNAKIVFVGA